MTIVEVEKPPRDNKRKPKYQHHELTVDENHPKAVVSSSGFPSVNPTPSSSFSEKEIDSSPHRVLSNQSVDFVFSSSSEKGSSKSIIGGQQSIGPSITPTIPAELESPPKVQDFKQTTKTKSDISTEEPFNYEMQGDDGNIPSHITRRSIGQNKPKPQEASSVSPSEDANMPDLNSMTGEHTTVISLHYTLSGEEIPLFIPKNQLQLAHIKIN